MALKGIKVIELAGLAPAPFCGMILADFGATVLHVDKVGSSTNLDCLKNGKKSIAINLKDEEGKRILCKLSKQSDVLIEPFRKGVMESLGLGPNVLCKDNPKLIYARLTGYGQEGPFSVRAGHDINYLALSGLLSLFGRSGEKPTFPVNLAADFGGGGLTCALGILLALIERSNSGLGQIVDCSMVEGAAYLGSWLYRSQKLPIWGKERGKNILDTGSHFYEVYETKDGKYMSVGALEPHFYSQLLHGLNIDHENAEQYDDFEKNKMLLEKIFKEKTQLEWCKIFDETDACVAPVLTLDEAPRHPHNMKQNSFVKSADDDRMVPKPAPKLSRTPGKSKSIIKMAQNGQHTEEILKSLNYSDIEITELTKKGVVGVCSCKSKL